MSTIKCIQCNKTIDLTEKFCPHCGKAIDHSTAKHSIKQENSMKTCSNPRMKIMIQKMMMEGVIMINPFKEKR